MQLTCFTDADCACDLDDRKSIGSYCIYLGNNLISWSSKKQSVVTRSSAGVSIEHWQQLVLSLLGCSLCLQNWELIAQINQQSGVTISVLLNLQEIQSTIQGPSILK